MRITIFSKRINNDNQINKLIVIDLGKTTFVVIYISLIWNIWAKKGLEVLERVDKDGEAIQYYYYFILE